jgi:hypothetical protein
MQNKVTGKYLEIEGRKYFRGNAQQVRLGTFGEKRNSLLSEPFLEPFSTMKQEFIAPHVIKNKPVAINWENTNKGSFEANGPVRIYGINGEVDANGTFEKGIKAKLKLVFFYIVNGELGKILNNKAIAARNYLAEEGSNGRIVSGVWFVMEAEIAEYFDIGGSASISAKGAGEDLEVTVSGGKHGVQTLILSRGGIFAYHLSKVTDWKDKKSIVADMKDDYYGW